VAFYTFASNVVDFFNAFMQNVLCPLQKRQNQKCILQVPAHAISPLLNFHRDLRPQGGLFERSIVVCASHLGPAGTVHIPRHTVATRTRSIMSRPGKLGRTCSNAPRLGFLVLFILAQLLAPAETGQAGQRVGSAPRAAFAAMPSTLPHIGLHRCVQTVLRSASGTNAGIAGDTERVKVEQGLQKSLDTVMSESGAPDDVADYQGKIDARLMSTRQKFSEEREKKKAAKQAAYEQSLASNYQLRTTHNYLLMVQKNMVQQDMELQESRKRRDDDFGLTDEEDGGVTEDGYKKKSKKKFNFPFMGVKPEQLVDKATEKAEGKGKRKMLKSWWRQLWNRET
jgi:hypothetical protein